LAIISPPGGVDAEVERDERPPLALCGGHRLREVDQRAGELVELGDDEHVSLPAGHPL